MKDFRTLKVWEKSHALALEIYKATANFPKSEQFGLTAQMRRSGSSIPTNIVEGCGRGSNADFNHFLRISMGSACEVEYQLLLSKDLGYLNDADYKRLNDLVVEIKRMLASLINKIKAEC